MRIMEIKNFGSINSKTLASQSRVNESNYPEVDEQYFEKLAAFGLACLAAAVVGKLIMGSLSKEK
jgi:hypothetical protein